MKKMIRILSAILALLTVISMFSGCAFTSNKKITKGEFFALFMEQAGLYYISDEPSLWDIGYNAEAQAMVDWGLLSKEDAFEGLTGYVTKETVLTVCINNMYFVKQGNVNSFKDASLCNNPQLMANAVATGLVELENGYLDANQKISRTECIEYINTSLYIDSNSHFEDGSGTVEYDYGDDVKFFTGDDVDPTDIEVFGYTNEQYCGDKINNDILGLSFKGVSSTDTLPLSTYGSKSISTEKYSEDVSLQATYNDSDRFRVYIPDNAFRSMKNPKIGDEIIFMPWLRNSSVTQTGSFNDLLSKGFAGKLLEITKIGMGYECEFERLDDEKIISGIQIEKYGKKAKENDLSIEMRNVEVDGFSISFLEQDNGYMVKIEKTFDISQNEYNNWRDWTVKPKLTYTASITDFHVDCDNIKYLVSNSKREKTLLSLSYNTTQDIVLESGGLRLAPDSNRNGKFASNISKSRFTSGAGAKYVKIGQIKWEIPQLGIVVPITVYLEISIDGKITIHFKESTNIRVIKQNGQFRFAKETSKSRSFEMTGNLDAGVRIEAGVNFALMRKSLVVFFGKVGVNVSVYSKVYEGKTLLNTGYADAGDLVHERSEQTDMHFCLDISAYVYGEIGFCEGASYGSYLADIFKKLKKDINEAKLRYQGDPMSVVHLEDGLSFKSNAVHRCTMGDEVDINKDGEIQLDSYKEIMVENDQISLRVLSLPMKQSKIENNGGVQIKVQNSDIVKAEYDEQLNLLNIYAIKNGSTEIEIIILNTKKTKSKEATYFTQTISVTVVSDGID